MCGILGGTRNTYHFEPAVKSLCHRGPDSSKIVHNEGLSLGFTRLAIIDLTPNADQPMASEDKNVWIVFNGEIYGFRQLREKLMAKGHRFRTKSDTEVILNAYLEWGDGFVDQVDGMFAIAIHDLRTHKLKLFRDRAGIKPLYYFYDGKEFAFASELKGIVQLCHNIKFEYDTTALYDYLTYSYIPEPKTLYKNIFKLLPAHQLTLDLREKSIIKINPYWQLSVHPIYEHININEVCEKLRCLIHESVKEQLVADVPVGCFLSGGMDSSIVVAEASSIMEGLETFSIGFENKKYNETEFAELVARNFGTHHHSKTLSQLKIDELLKKLNPWFDEPFADTSAFPTYFVSEFSRQQVTVALTGDGGDEIFGGYTRFKKFNFLLKFPHIQSFQAKLFLSSLKSKYDMKSLPYKALSGSEILFSEPLATYGMLTGELPLFKKLSYAKRWGIPNDYDIYWYFRKYYKKDLPPLTRMQYLDFHTYLPSDILTKLDRTTMAVSLEGRLPFLSRKIIEFMFSLPENIRYYKSGLKGLLKEAYKDILPKENILRPKMGFAIPLQSFCKHNQTVQEKILTEAFEIR